MRKTLLAAAAVTAVFSFAAFAVADSNAITFESYALGTINNQDGWSSTGAAGSGCAVYDHAVSTSGGTTGFGTKSLRISNAVVSGCFGDQTFAKPLVNSVGESTASAGTFSPGVKQNHFETQFDLASVVPGAVQPGLYMSVSPDRGDGSRMSYLRFEDNAAGIDVFFDDVTSAQTVDSDVFHEDKIATLNRAVPHTIKLTLDVVDGPSNDIVKVFIDGALATTGTSWEDYYRYDTEASAEQTVRIVKTTLFRTGGSTNNPSVAGKGFLIDNLSQLSGLTPVGTEKEQCKDGGWKNFTTPVFKNQGQCVSYMNHV